MSDPNDRAGFLYPLFELMSREHGLTLLDSEMDEIRDVCRKLEEKAAMQELVYDPDMEIPPIEIFNAARAVERYFKQRGMGYWEYCGIASRFKRPFKV